MYRDTIEALSKQAEDKVGAQRASFFAHFTRSILAGMYVGASVVLVLVLGSLLPKEVQKLVMGASFGGALTMVIFAGSELFTGANLIVTLGVFTGKVSIFALLWNWIVTWVGNLCGGALLAWMVVHSGILDADPTLSFVLAFVEKKMNLPPEPLFLRAVLANWLVCLAIWMSTRTTSDAARILLIWWCMFTFIACGYEHSVANMCSLSLGLLLPHGAGITLERFGYNLAVVTGGNIVGGAIFVALMYWIGSLPRVAATAPAKRKQKQAAPVDPARIVDPAVTDAASN